MTNMPVLVVLAGGASSRMWPLQEKLLLGFAGAPLLTQQLQRYTNEGFDEVVVVASPGNAAAIRAIVAQVAGVRGQVVVQDEPKGMGDAVLQVAPLLRDRADVPLYVMQAHDVVDEDLHRAMLVAYRQTPGATHLAGYEMDAYFPGGYLVVEAGQIRGIVEKPGPDKRPSNLVNIVAHVHRNAGELFAAIETEYAKDIPADDHYERAMHHLMQAAEYRVVPYKGVWKALKYPWHVLDVMDYFLARIAGQQIAESAFVAETAVLVGDVFVGEGARIFPGAAVVGPAYIGAGTIIGNNALVRNSMVLDHCEVGFTTEIARSYVAENCAMHACRVLDSVFAPGVNFSAGCTTANLRIDRGDVFSPVKGERVNTGRDKFGAAIGNGAFLGVDVMTMPGVKIGAGAQIGPGTHVRHDVKAGQRIYVKQEIVVVEDE